MAGCSQPLPSGWTPPFKFVFCLMLPDPFLLLFRLIVFLPVIVGDWGLEILNQQWTKKCVFSRTSILYWEVWKYLSHHSAELQIYLDLFFPYCLVLSVFLFSMLCFFSHSFSHLFGLLEFFIMYFPLTDLKCKHSKYSWLLKKILHT